MPTIFWLMKPEKSGSSTLTNVIARICRWSVGKPIFCACAVHWKRWRIQPECFGGTNSAVPTRFLRAPKAYSSQSGLKRHYHHAFSLFVLSVEAAMKFSMAKQLLLGTALLTGLSSTWAQGKVVNVYNWAEYTAPDTISGFQEATGIQVRYDVYDSNDTLQA